MWAKMVLALPLYPGTEGKAAAVDGKGEKGGKLCLTTKGKGLGAFHLL